MVTITAIIPIKHNSERVPGKNFRVMNGKPLYQWIINTLLNTPEINKIIINTDSPILFNNIPKLYKKEFENKKIVLYERPEKLRSGSMSVNTLLLDTIESLNLKSDFFLQTHTTNPLLRVDTIKDAIYKFINNDKGYTSLFSVKKHQTRFYTKDGKDMNHNRFHLIKTQDLDPIYEENSCIYIFTYNSLKKFNARISDNAMLYIMNELESSDIDWEHDFILTNEIMKLNIIDKMFK